MQFQEGRIVIRRRSPFKVAAAAAIMLLAGGGLAACSSGGGGNSASGNSPIVACGDLALAGPYAQIGESDNWGAQAYFKSVNKTGGIDGHKVTYVTLNNQSNAAQSELDAQQCVEKYHAQFIIGPESGADTESALPIAIAHKTILISLSSGWQSNGYPTNELTSYGFPGFYDVFAEDQIASVQNLIVPRHYTRVALLDDNCGSVCLANQATVQALAAKDGFQLVSTQIDQVGATDVTPQVLALLAAKPQIILFGLVPGTDSITAIKAIRAQDPTIPISECSGCEIPSFVSAAGGPTAMKNIYVLGSMRNWLTQAQQGTTATDKATAAGLTQYIAGMQAAGLGNDNAIENSQEGWDAGLEIDWAIKQAGNLNETTIMQKLQHLDINTLGIVWTRTPTNYESYSEVDAAMATINSDGSASLYAAPASSS
jgi:branched-chain amino acid transport system substrate-binding protein